MILATLLNFSVCYLLSFVLIINSENDILLCLVLFHSWEIIYLRDASSRFPSMMFDNIESSRILIRDNSLLSHNNALQFFFWNSQHMLPYFYLHLLHVRCLLLIILLLSLCDDTLNTSLLLLWTNNVYVLKYSENGTHVFATHTYGRCSSHAPHDARQ